MGYAKIAFLTAAKYIRLLVIKMNAVAAKKESRLSLFNNKA